MTELSVTHDPRRQVFELVLPGGDVAGYAEYVPLDGAVGGSWAVTHVIVQPQHGGQGFGTRLAEAVLDAAREQGVAVLPHCSFVREHLRRHPELVEELVPAEERRRFGLAA